MSSQTACPMKRLVGLAKLNPLGAAAEALVFSRSAVWLSRDSSSGENNVTALQSSPLKTLG